ncbi:MAG: L-threonylcarbamoyladenylate synthase [Boseongicola sp.]
MSVKGIETKVLGTSATDIGIAAEIMRGGGLVAFPTETVYGLGAEAFDDAAVARIFEAKSRPSFNPLIAHITGIEAARTLCDVSDEAERLAAAFWPGALTLVLGKRDGTGISPLVTAGGPYLAVRAPDGDVVRSLLQEVGRPVAAPSANLSGQISTTTAEHVLAGLSGKIDAIIDGGPCPIGVESTIVGFDGAPRLLRAGGLPVEAIEACLGTRLVRGHADGRPVAPGQLESHYAPGASVRLNAIEAQENEFLIGFGEVKGHASLSETGDLTEAASRLFHILHKADASGRPIAVAPVPESGLGLAINDRLKRAASPRQ